MRFEVGDIVQEAERTGILTEEHTVPGLIIDVHPHPLCGDDGFQYVPPFVSVLWLQPYGPQIMYTIPQLRLYYREI